MIKIIKSLMMFILFLTFFNFAYFFAMEKLHLDTVALIVVQPGTMIIKEHNPENSDTKPQQTSFQQLNNFCNQFMPAFNLLLTCKSYYNDDFKNKVKNLLMGRYIPQGVLIQLCPSYMHYKILENKTYVEIKEVFEKLGNLCIQTTPITDDQIQEIVKSDAVSEKLDYIVYIPSIINTKYRLGPDTLIEYIFFKEKVDILNFELFKATRKNRFILIHYLCNHKKINPKLPISNDSLSLEDFLTELYKFDLDEDTLLPSIIQSFSKNKPPKNIYERPREEPAVIEIVADLFLFSQYQIYLN